MVQAWVLDSRTVSSNHARRRQSAAMQRTGNASGFRLARAVFFVLAFVILFSGLTLMRTFASSEHVEPASAQEVVIYADSGDTLWTLASSVKKPSMDIRRAVHMLMERNQLQSPAIQIGQALIVPAELLP